MDLSELKIKCQNCRLCKLSQARVARNGKAVFGEGNRHAKFMFIGQNPGKGGDTTGKPFFGDPSGNLFRECIIKLENISWFTNVVKCRYCYKGKRGYSNYSDTKLLNEKEVIKICTKNYLEKEIKIINPNYIIPLGDFARKIILSSKFRKKVYGKKFKHPSRVLREAKMPKYKHINIIEDYKKQFDDLLYV